jgi:uncharacterized protein (DUF58 family)
LLIIREILTFKPVGKGTDIGAAMRYIHNGLKKRCVCFVLSDFLGTDYEEAMRVLARRHDLIGLHCWDPLERDLPDVGVLRVADAETGAQTWVDTTSTRLRRQYWQTFEAHTQSTQALFRRAGADFLSLCTNQPYVHELLKFFAQRSKVIAHG